MFEGVDTGILYDELAYQDTVPLRWQSLKTPLPAEASGQLLERNVRLLQATAALEEQGQLEKPDENSPNAADILRLDMKMNLLLDLMGRLLVANQPRPPARFVRFNARGAVWKEAGATLAPGDEGVLELYLKDCIVDPLRLQGRVANVTPDGQVKVKFQNPGEAICDLLEKLAFRKHRRQVADQKQPRAFDPTRTGRFRR